MADGEFVAVWVQPAAVGPGELRMRRLDKQGALSGAETLVAASGSLPDVAALADGGFVVTWTDWRTIDDRQGHLQVFNADGSRRSGIVTLAGGPFTSYVARAVGLADGRFVVAASALAGRQGTDIGTVQLFSREGLVLAQPVVVNTNPADNRTHILGIIAAPSEAGFAAAWTTSSPTGSELRLGLFGQDGRPAALVTVDAGPAEKRTPALARLANGNLVIAWAAFDSGVSGSTQTLWVERLDRDGRSLGRQAVPTGAVDRPFRLDVAATGNGGFVVASSTSVDVSLGLNRRTVTTQAFDAAASSLGAAETVAVFDLPSLALSGLETLNLAGAAGAAGGQYVLLYGSYSAATDWDVMAAIR